MALHSLPVPLSLAPYCDTERLTRYFSFMSPLVGRELLESSQTKPPHSSLGIAEDCGAEMCDLFFLWNMRGVAPSLNYRGTCYLLCPSSTAVMLKVPAFTAPISGMAPPDSINT